MNYGPTWAWDFASALLWEKRGVRSFQKSNWRPNSWFRKLLLFIQFRLFVTELYLHGSCISICSHFLDRWSGATDSIQTSRNSQRSSLHDILSTVPSQCSWPSIRAAEVPGSSRTGTRRIMAPPASTNGCFFLQYQGTQRFLPFSIPFQRDVARATSSQEVKPFYDYHLR